MAQLDRRSFVAALTVLPATLSAAQAESAAALGALFIAPSDRELLIALAGAVLPGELGSARITRCGRTIRALGLQLPAGRRAEPRLRHG